MPKLNLSGMTVEALMNLREQVDETLLKRRADIERQLARMDGGAALGSGPGRGSRGRRQAVRRY
jgi:hypothetical protein